MPRGHRQIEQRRQGRGQHHETQENLPSRESPRRLLGPQQVHHAPRHHRQRQDQQESRRLRRIDDQMPLVAPDIPDDRPHRSESAQLDRGIPPQHPAIQDVEQQAGHGTQGGPHQDPHAEFRALQHGSHHQQRRQRRKHPERRELGHAHAIQQPEQVKPAGFAGPLVFRKQPSRPQQHQQMERARQRTGGENPKRNARHREQTDRRAGQQPGLFLAPRFVRIVQIMDRVAHAHHQPRDQPDADRPERRADRADPEGRGTARQPGQQPHQIPPQRIQQRGTGVEPQMPSQTLGWKSRKRAAAQRAQVQPQRRQRQAQGNQPAKPRRRSCVVAFVHTLASNGIKRKS